MPARGSQHAYLQIMGVQRYVRRSLDESPDSHKEIAPAQDAEPGVPASIQEAVEEPVAESPMQAGIASSGNTAEQPLDAQNDLAAYLEWDNADLANELEDSWLDDGLVQSADQVVPDDIATLDWRALQQRVAECRACELCQTRKNTVFGVGNPAADVMIIGEAPGADEDAKGEPFVGRAGKLLDAMLKAIGLDRQQVFIANILKCRPPANRNPSAGETASCEPYLLRQIELIQPKLILSVGGVSAHNLLKTDEKVGVLRQRWQMLESYRIPVQVTYHPAYLLRQPGQKAKAWEDLLKLKKAMLEKS